MVKDHKGFKYGGTLLLNCPGAGERFVHEPLFGEAGPPLGRPPIGSVKHSLAQSRSRLVPQLKRYIILECIILKIWTTCLAGMKILSAVVKQGGPSARAPRFDSCSTILPGCPVYQIIIIRIRISQPSQPNSSARASGTYCTMSGVAWRLFLVITDTFI